MYNITCESTCDLPFEYLQKRNCNVIFYSYYVDDEEFSDSMQRRKPALFNLYEALGNKKVTTSQINVQQYEDFFRAQAANGDLLHLAFSSGLSQSVNNAIRAAENLAKENFPHKVVVVDTLCGGGGYGFFVDAVLNERDSGAEFDAVCTWAEENKQKAQSYLFSADLTHFRRSGRVSGLTAFIGNLLRLCPIMHVNNEGKIVAHDKAISEKRAISRLVAEMEAHAKNGKQYNGKLWIQHSNCFALGAQAKLELQKAFSNLSEVRMMDVGTVMACHCGPDTVAIYFWGESR